MKKKKKFEIADRLQRDLESGRIASGSGAAAEWVQALSEEELFQVENWLEEEPPTEVLMVSILLLQAQRRSESVEIAEEDLMSVLSSVVVLGGMERLRRLGVIRYELPEGIEPTGKVRLEWTGEHPPGQIPSDLLWPA